MIHFQTSKIPEHILITFESFLYIILISLFITIILLLFIVTLESKKKVEKKRCRRCRRCSLPPKFSIIKVKCKKFWGKPIPPPLFYTTS
jgi:hypothetical protein